MGFDVGGITLTSPSGTTLDMDNGATSWMKVNANGVLTRPQTPYFRGQISGHGSAYNAGGGPLLIAADVNFGGCWNDATGLWTCPVTGYYMTTFGSICGGIPSSGYPHIRLNGSSYCYNHWNHASNWTYVSLSAVVYGVAGDTISYGLTAYTAGAGVHGNGNHAMYSIALMA